MGHTHFNPENLNERFEFPSRLRNIVFGLIGVGIVLLIVGIFMADTGAEVPHEEGAHDEHALVIGDQAEIVPVADEHGDDAHAGHHEGRPVTLTTRILANFLLAGMYFFMLSLGAMFFLTIHKVGNGGWQTAIRRIPEAMMTYLPIGAIVFAVLLFFLDTLFDWSYFQANGIHDHLIDAKAGWLNKPFFIGRTIVFIGVWGVIGWLIRRWSLAQDNDLDNALSYFKKEGVASSIFIVFFAISFTLFSVDWIKSLEPHWFSTIFGVYNFARSMVASMVVMYLITAYLKSQGYLKFVQQSHFHDFGGYAFGFTIFWAYIWISQYMLIWYANIPEETFYYVKRYRELDATYLGGNFNLIFYANIIVNFFIPFLALVHPKAKRNIAVFLPVGILMLYGHWHDLYQEIMPGAVGTEWNIGLIELGMFMAFAGLFLFVVFRSLGQANLYAKHHPYMEESVNHNTGEVYKEFDLEPQTT